MEKLGFQLRSDWLQSLPYSITPGRRSRRGKEKRRTAEVETWFLPSRDWPICLMLYCKCLVPSLASCNHSFTHIVRIYWVSNVWKALGIQWLMNLNSSRCSGGDTRGNRWTVVQHGHCCDKVRTNFWRSTVLILKVSTGNNTYFRVITLYFRTILGSL